MTSSIKHSISKHLWLVAAALMLTGAGNLFGQTAEFVDVSTPRAVYQDPVTIVGMDILVPGYGMYRTKSYYFMGAYFVAKALSGYFLYYSIRNLDYVQSLERAASKRQSKETRVLEFKDPQNPGTTFTYKEIRNDVGPAALTIMFAALTNLAVYTVSAVHTYSRVRANNNRLRPKFKIEGYRQASVSWDFRF